MNSYVFHYTKYPTKNHPTQEIGNAFVQALAAEFNSAGDFHSVFTKKPDSEIERLSNEHCPIDTLP